VTARAALVVMGMLVVAFAAVSPAHVPARVTSTSATSVAHRSGPATPVPRFPASKNVAAAANYLSARAGVKAFAVIDNRGKLAGANVHLRFHSASTVKSMLLVAYLQTLAAEHRGLTDSSRDLLYPMIHSSSNEAATAVLEAIGEARLNAVARDAGMRNYEPGGESWGFTEISAADMARFFLIQDSLIPHRFDGYARWLLSTIEPSESWGIPAVARPEFQVFFKGGWLPEIEGLVNQVARLERPHDTFAMAVLSRDDPSMAYGEETIEGVTARLLGGTFASR
jgi:Beta-lactamase enzyme family